MAGEAGILSIQLNPVFDYLLSEIINLSSMSYEDDLKLRATYYYYTHDKFQCDSKIDKHAELLISRKKVEPQTAYEQAEKLIRTSNGCEVIRDKSLYVIDGYEFFTCVCNFKHNDFNYLTTLFDAFDSKGVMPFEGAYADQPAKIVDIFQTLKQLKLEVEAMHREKANKQNNNKR